MDDKAPNSVHPVCDCEVPLLKTRIYYGCTWMIDALNGVSESHDLCVYNTAVLIAVQKIHLREGAGIDLQEIELIMKKAEDTAELMYAHSTKNRDPEGSENRRRTLC